MATEQSRSAVSIGLATFLQSSRDAAVPVAGSIYDALNRNVGILSLTEAPDDVLMWAHYADSHRGLLLGFDENHSFFNRRRSDNDEFYFLRRVVYADSVPAASLSALGGDTIFVTKVQKWAYEREWRMLAPLSDSVRCVEVGDERVHLYPFPPEALAAVVVGGSASRTLEASARTVINANPDLQHVRVSRVVLCLDDETVRADMPGPQRSI
jgi:hypothetical protein